MADALLTFMMADAVVLPIERRFITEHLNNSVMPRLVGFHMDDELSTREVSKDAEGHLTILHSLGICSADMLHLMQWLRTKSVPSEFRQRAYETSIKLGGLDALDRAMTEGAAPTKAPRQPRQPLPACPRDDVHAEYQWFVLNINRIDHPDTLMDRGWSVAGPYESNTYMSYLRRWWGADRDQNVPHVRHVPHVLHVTPPFDDGAAMIVAATDADEAVGGASEGLPADGGAEAT